MASRNSVECLRSRRQSTGRDLSRIDLGSAAHLPVGRPVRSSPLESVVSASPTPGILYIVSTPVGNLGDFSFRAVEVLKTVSVVLAEDTRHTRHLLDRYQIRTPLVAHHEHNEAKTVAGLVERLAAG